MAHGEAPPPAPPPPERRGRTCCVLASRAPATCWSRAAARTRASAAAASACRSVAVAAASEVCSAAVSACSARTCPSLPASLACVSRNAPCAIDRVSAQGPHHFMLVMAPAADLGSVVLPRARFEVGLGRGERVAQLLQFARGKLVARRRVQACAVLVDVDGPMKGRVTAVQSGPPLDKNPSRSQFKKKKKYLEFGLGAPCGGAEVGDLAVVPLLQLRRCRRQLRLERHDTLRLHGQAL